MLHISKCFNQSITNIQHQAEKLQELQKIILDYIPIEMQNICKIAGFSDGCLILNVTDSVWASQLRFLLPEIRDNLRKNHNIYELSSIKITINRNQSVTYHPATKKIQRNPSQWKKVLESLNSN